MAMTRDEILLALQGGTLEIAEASKLLGALENQRQSGVLSFKVSEKGAVSVYGLQRMPVTLYFEQWERFIPVVKDGSLEKFIAANKGNLSTKADKVAAVAKAKAAADVLAAKADGETDAQYAARKAAK